MRTPMWLLLVLADIAIILSVSQIMFGSDYPNALERHWDTTYTRAKWERFTGHVMPHEPHRRSAAE